MKKIVQHKLQVTKNKVSNQWKKYRKEKQKILKNKRIPLDIKRGLLQEKRDITKHNISTFFEDYRGYKYSKVHSSPYPEFAYSKKYETINSIQKTYKAKREYNENNLDKLVPKILNEQAVKGVLVIYRVYDEETELISYVSDFITKLLYERLQAKNISLDEHLSTKLRYSKSVQEYELKGIYIKVIYEKSKISKN